MKTEVYNATSMGVFTSVSATAKTALLGPQTKETVAAAKADISALVSEGKIVVENNLHTLLNTPNPQTVFNANGAAAPTVYHNLDSLNIKAKKIALH
jgi:hypothetical protein